MSKGYRVFLVDGKDDLHRISHKRFDALTGAGQTVPEHFLGYDKVRCVVVVYQTENRKPAELIQMDFDFIPLTSAGLVDTERNADRTSLLGQAFPLLDGVDGAGPSTIVDGRQRFAKKRLDHEWRWQPSDELYKKICEAVWGRLS
ncbi:MAG: hypothetical protein AAGM22_05330 [Acidobacteriota bacterium]